MIEILEFIGNVSDVAGFLGAIFALLAWLQSRRTARQLAAEQARQEERIEITLLLTDEGRERVLPMALRRRELTRAELLGRLGMMPMATPGARFSLRYLSTPEFLGQLEAAQAATGPFRFELPCASAQEFDQFAA